MRRIIAPIVLLMAGPAALAAGPAPSGPADALQLQLQDARREAAQAQSQQQKIERAAAAARDAATRLRLEQLAAAQAIMAQEARISSADAEASLLARQLSAQRQRLAVERAPLSSLLAGLALSGRRPLVSLIAGGGSPEELVKLNLLVKAVTPAIEARTAALAQQVARVAQLQSAAIEAKGAASTGRQLLARRKVELAKLEAEALALADRRGSEALVQGDVTLARGEHLSDLQREDADSRYARTAAAELARLGPIPLPDAANPVARPPLAYSLPVQAAVTDGLGSISETGVRSRGITFATRRGVPVLAPADGTIVFAGPFRDYDGVIILDHGGGWRSVLVNAGSTLPKGSRVVARQRIGLALGQLELQLQSGGRPVSAAIIAGSSAMLSKTAQSD